MFTLLLNSNVALLGLPLSEPFIVLTLSLTLVVLAGIARRVAAKGLAKTSRQVQSTISIHTSKVGEETI